MKTIFFIAILVITAGLLSSFIYKYPGKKDKRSPKVSEVKHPEWSRHAVIYEVNIRQYSSQGTFAAFEQDLPRLKKLGVDILWIMPVNPIGMKNRKMPLGSYYSVKDFKAINPEFGNMDDFKHLVKSIHNLGLKVVLDWVPNHSSWDNELVTTHPEYYKKDSTGKMVSPFDWTDVVQFDYHNAGLRSYMLETMKWWLQETDIDGFRCDVAHLVPVDFWNEARVELDRVKEIFLMAESDQPFLHEQSFDLTYDWKFHHLMNDIAKGTQNANQIARHFAWVDSIYPANSYLMEFTSNHDENSWAGTEYERLGAGAKTFAVLAATVPGIMLIYNGQEAGFNRRLKFFEKDPIDWKQNEMFEFYQHLVALHKQHKALENGLTPGSMTRVLTGKDSAVFAFIREKEGDRILVILNLTGKVQSVRLAGKLYQGTYQELFTGKMDNFKPNTRLSLPPWAYSVYTLKK